MTDAKEVVSDIVAAKLTGRASKFELWVFVQYGREEGSLGMALCTAKEAALQCARNNVMSGLQLHDSTLSREDIAKIADEAVTTISAKKKWKSPHGQWYCVDSRPLYDL